MKAPFFQFHGNLSSLTAFGVEPQSLSENPTPLCPQGALPSFTHHGHIQNPSWISLYWSCAHPLPRPFSHLFTDRILYHRLYHCIMDTSQTYCSLVSRVATSALFVDESCTGHRHSGHMKWDVTQLGQQLSNFACRSWVPSVPFHEWHLVLVNC